MKKLISSLALLSLSLAVPAAASAPAIDGRYTDDGGFVEITVAPCGAARCGIITRIIKRKPGEPLNDAHNDNPALRDRAIRGITILQNLRFSDGAWRGRIYNPEDGGTYRAEVRPAARGGLEVKGCLAFICRTRNFAAVR